MVLNLSVPEVQSKMFLWIDGRRKERPVAPNALLFINGLDALLVMAAFRGRLCSAACSGDAGAAYSDAGGCDADFFWDEAWAARILDTSKSETDWRGPSLDTAGAELDCGTEKRERRDGLKELTDVWDSTVEQSDAVSARGCISARERFLLWSSMPSIGVVSSYGGGTFSFPSSLAKGAKSTSRVGSVDAKLLHSGNVRASADVLMTVEGRLPKRPDRAAEGRRGRSLASSPNFRVPSPSGLNENVERLLVRSTVVVLTVPWEPVEEGGELKGLRRDAYISLFNRLWCLCVLLLGSIVKLLRVRRDDCGHRAGAMDGGLPQDATRLRGFRTEIVDMLGCRSNPKSGCFREVSAQSVTIDSSRSCCGSSVPGREMVRREGAREGGTQELVLLFTLAGVDPGRVSSGASLSRVSASQTTMRCGVKPIAQ